MKTALISTTVTVLLSSCTLTGDPTGGGIFWSESMAQERQRAMQSELQTKQTELENLQRENSSLQSRRAALQKELRALRQQRAVTGDAQQARNLDDKISRLESLLSVQ